MSEQEFDFKLVIDGVPDLTDAVEDALFKAGCDDATFSIQFGRLCADFSRRAPSLETAILSAIGDVAKAGIGAAVSRVDECDYVTPAEIARRINRTRQQVCQYIKGTRGPGKFPPPECHLSDRAPLWAWCAVSHWLAANNLIRPEEQWNAQVIASINTMLDYVRQSREYPQLVREIQEVLNAGRCPTSP